MVIQSPAKYLFKFFTKTEINDGFSNGSVLKAFKGDLQTINDWWSFNERDSRIFENKKR